MALEEMTCRELVEIVTDYLEGALSDRIRLRLEAHLAGCPHCRLYLTQMRLTIAALGSLRDAPTAPEGRTGDPTTTLTPPGNDPGWDRFTFYPL